ncbi:MAG: mechanosensitive ion channel [Verrucomicrobiota bacterium]
METFFAAVGDLAVTNNVLLNPRAGGFERLERATGVPPIVWSWVFNAVGAAIILLIGYLVAGLTRNVIRRLCGRRAIDQTVASFVGNLVHALIMTFVVITALSQVGVDTKSFAAIIAAAGLAIGLALQGGLSNFAAGFLIIVFRPFRKGDAIQGAGVEGVVEEVQIFSTILNTGDNKRIIIPNSSLMGSTITNYSANPTRRVDVAFSIGAGQDLNKAHEVLLSLATANPRVIEKPTVANIKLIEGGSQVELRAWCKTGDYGDLLGYFVAEGPRALAGAGIKGPDKTVYHVERRDVPSR